MRSIATPHRACFTARLSPRSSLKRTTLTPTLSDGIAAARMIDNETPPQEPLMDRIDWAYLVATAAGGAAVGIDGVFFRHRHMEAAGVSGFVGTLLIMGTLELVRFKKKGR